MIVTGTPLRFSLLGGGSDFPQYWKYGQGHIISMTLDAHIYVTYTPRRLYGYSAKTVHGNNIRVSYTKTENVDSVEEIQHDIVREVCLHLREFLLPYSFELTTIGDAPAKGAGLGTSSSLTVGLIKAFLHPIEGFKLAGIASQVEIGRLKRMIGVQDHLAAAFGGLRYYVLEGSDEGYGYRLVHNRPFDWEFGSRLADHLLAFRLPVNKSDEADAVAPHRTLDEMVAQIEDRAVFIKKTCEMLIEPTLKAIYELDFETLGKIISETWRLKKESHAIVDTRIDRWYNLGIEAGAFGGKVSGSVSNGAGHLFFVCDPVKHDAVRDALGGELAEMRVGYFHSGSTRLMCTS